MNVFFAFLLPDALRYDNGNNYLQIRCTNLKS